MTIERPMFPPSRRGFLALVGGSAAAAATVSTQPAIAAPSEALDSSKVSPAFRDAVIALRESHEGLEAAKAAHAESERQVAQWEAENPQPTGKRARKRWYRRSEEYSHKVGSESWQDLLAAERHFKAAQMVVAKINPADENELGLMAAVAVIYDAEKLVTGRGAIISYGVSLGMMRLRLPPCA